MKAFIPFLVCAVIFSSSYGCTCSWEGDFWKLYKEENALVILCTVKEHANSPKERIPELRKFLWDKYKQKIPVDYVPPANSMIVSIEKVLVGEYSKNELEIWCMGGMICEPEVEEFPVGSRWILIPKKENFQVVGPERDYLVYRLSFCGEYYLREVENVFVGFTDDPEVKEPTLITEEELKKLSMLEPVAGGDAAR
jgi:hypothetical protein